MDIDFDLESITPNITTVLTVGSTGALGIPNGTTAQRPGSPVNGLIRYNSDIAGIEIFIAGSWNPQSVTGEVNAARVATTGNVTLTAPGATIDGITMVAGNRVLVWQQTTASQNGVYTWNGAAVTMTRVADMLNNWDITVTGRNILIDQGTLYAGFTFFAISPTGGTYNTTAMDWSGDFFQIGDILFGNSATVTRASTGGFGMRNFTLLDTNASLRTWRFLPSSSGNSCGIEMIVGNNDDLANPANFWWDISTQTDSQEGVRIAQRTGGVIAPKLFIDLNGRLTVGTTVLSGGTTGPAFASSAGVGLYVNSTDAIVIPVGTTAQRPVTPFNGMIRYNSSLTRNESYENTAWIQSSGIIDKSTVPQTVTLVAGATIFSYSVPGGTLGTNGVLRLTMRGTWSNIAAAAAHTATIVVSFGGTTLWTDTTASLPLAAGNITGWDMNLTLVANNSASAQVLNGSVVFGPTGAATTGTTGNFGTAPFSTANITGTTALDSSVARVFLVSVSFSGTGSTTAFVKQFHTLERL